MKKLFLLFVLMLLPLAASADDSGKCGENVYYSYNSTTHTLTISGEGGIANSPWSSFCNDIQSVIIESGVTRICSEVFRGCSSLTSITIPDGVTSIGSEAFVNCVSLSSITIPNSVTRIDNYAFERCGLTSIKIPNSVTTISGGAFWGCGGLTSVTIPNSVTKIGSSAFERCGLTSIKIPNSVTSIASNAFSSCSGLTSIQVESGNQNYDSRNNCNAIIDSNNQLIAGCKNTIIPNSVTSIGSSAFSGCSSLTSITIPNNVTSIGNYAFYGCSGLTSIAIPNNVTTIGNSVFNGCRGLVYITLPSKLTSVGNYCFTSCKNLTDIYCNAKDVPSADNSAFNNTGNITLYVPYESTDSYKSTSPWGNFNVQTNNNSQGSEKCSKPTISLSDGRFVFNCEMPDVQYHWIISTPDGNNGYSNYSSVSYSFSQITLNVFATKDGYLPSDVATYELSGLVGDVNNDGKVDVADHVKLSEIIMGQK